MSDFKPNYKTREFISTNLVLVCLFVASFFIPSLRVWSYAVTVTGSSYMIGRALFKKNRAILISGAKSESGVYVACLSLLGYSLFSNKNDVETVLLMASIVQSAFNISRGYTKGLAQASNRMMIIP